MRMPRPALVPLLLLIACGDRADDPGRAAVPPPATPPTASPADTLDAARLAHGRQVYETVCAECHTLDAPPATAPTLREIVATYRALFPDAAEGIERIAEYTRAPVAARALLPKVMIDEWGVMPAQPLPAEDLAAVAHFIWHLPAAPDTTSFR